MSLRVQQLSLYQGKRQILHDISFELQPGEILVILGANGAGKSTLCHAISGYPSSIEGEIWLDQINVRQASSQTLARHRAFLSQKNTLEFNLRVQDIVEMGTYPFQECKNTHSIVEQALTWVHASHLASRDYLTLSGGEQQRIQFARVIAQLISHAKIYPDYAQYCILDEPTANLDPRYQQQLLQTLQQIAHHFNVGILIVLHDINLAAFYADRLLLLAEGHLLAQGSPSQTLTTENLYNTYGIQGYPITHPFYPDKKLIVWNKKD